jgi:hypothetical protein
MASNSSFDEIWDEAIQHYFSTTQRTYLEQSLMKKLRMTKDLQSQVDTDNEKFKSSRAKHGKLTGKLKNVVQPFTNLAKLVAAGLGASPFAPASAVVGVVVFTIRAADGVSEAYDWIEQLFDKLGNFTIRLQEYISEDVPKHFRAKVVQILACVLQILSQSEKAIKDKRWKKYTTLMFVGKKEVMKTSFVSLEGLFEEEQRLVTAITYVTNQRVDRKVDEVQQTSGELLIASKKVDAKVEEENKRKLRVEILKWLSPTDFTTQPSDI